MRRAVAEGDAGEDQNATEGDEGDDGLAEEGDGEGQCGQRLQVMVGTGAGGAETRHSLLPEPLPEGETGDGQVDRTPDGEAALRAALPRTP